MRSLKNVVCNKPLRIYWANALFSEADRSFNASAVANLRTRGCQVFLPQESEENSYGEPVPSGIFTSDTRELLSSDVLVACIDQETVDCGVACEIGIAFSFAIPIVGLYTDVRRARSGSARMYKNLYLIGAMESRGTTVHSTEGLLDAIHRVTKSDAIPSATKDREVLRHFSRISNSYDDFVRRLESWYIPRWTAWAIVRSNIKRLSPRHILDYGCGSGVVGQKVVSEFPDISYVGFDRAAPMIELARDACTGTTVEYTANFNELSCLAPSGGFDLAMALFTLHDLADPRKALLDLATSLSDGGSVLILDLSRGDLPRLTSNLRCALSRPALAADSRIGGAEIADMADSVGLQIKSCTLETPAISFASSAALDEYLTMFGVYRGMDIPLGLSAEDEYWAGPTCRRLLPEWTFPFHDRREFICCLLAKA